MLAHHAGQCRRGLRQYLQWISLSKQLEQVAAMGLRTGYRKPRLWWVILFAPLFAFETASRVVSPNLVRMMRRPTA